jgi:hypothetical protein
VWAFSQLQGLGIHLSVFLQENGPQLAGHLTGSAASAIFACGIEGTRKGGTAVASIERKFVANNVIRIAFASSPACRHCTRRG